MNKYTVTAGKLEGANIEARSEEHTSELQSPVPTSYAVFCLIKKKKNDINYDYLRQTKTDKPDQNIEQDYRHTIQCEAAD